MEYIALPPEVISALIHAGPGAASLLEASGAWQALSADLEETAGNYGAVLSTLATEWRGPSTLAMVQSVAPYLTWLRATAAQCQQLAASAQAAAAAFGTTLAAVVPPAEVAANRAQLAQLLATNGFGQNLAAIAATEAQYERMWVNNATAMYSYESTTAQAAVQQLFSTPPSITDPGSSAAQAQAVSVAQAQAVPAAAAAATLAAPADAVAPPVSPLDALLQAVGITFDPNEGWFGLTNTYINQFVSSGFPINLLSYFAQTTSAQALQGIAPDVFTGLSEGETALGGAEAGLAEAVGAFSAAGTPTGAMGVAVPMGTLSAPPAATAVLTAAHTPVQLASAASPLPAGDVDAAGFLPPLMAPPISAGSGWRKRKEQKYEDLAMGLEVEGKFIPRSPSAG